MNLVTCTREFFTHGGRATRPCGNTDGVVTCSECGNGYCIDCQAYKPMFNKDGKPLCEDCAFPNEQFLEMWEGDNA